MTYDALRGLGKYDALRGIDYQNSYRIPMNGSIGSYSTSFGATTQKISIPPEMVREFERKIDKTIADVRTITIQVVAAVKKKEDTWNPYAAIYYAMKGKTEDAEKLLVDVNSLKAKILEPDFETGAPILFARPNDALEFINNVAKTIRDQGKSLSKWADVGFLESGFDAFTDALSDNIAWAADYMAKVGGASVAKTLAKGGRDIKRGRIPYFTIAAIGVAAVAGVVAVRKVKKFVK